MRSVSLLVGFPPWTGSAPRAEILSDSQCPPQHLPLPWCGRQRQSWSHERGDEEGDTGRGRGDSGPVPSKKGCLAMGCALAGLGITPPPASFIHQVCAGCLLRAGHYHSCQKQKKQIRIPTLPWEADTPGGTQAFPGNVPRFPPPLAHPWVPVFPSVLGHLQCLLSNCIS